MWPGLKNVYGFSHFSCVRLFNQHMPVVLATWPPKWKNNNNRAKKGTNYLICSLAVDIFFSHYESWFCKLKKEKEKHCWLVLKACGSEFNLNMQDTEDNKTGTYMLQRIKYIQMARSNEELCYHNQDRCLCRNSYHSCESFPNFQQFMFAKPGEKKSPMTLRIECLENYRHLNSNVCRSSLIIHELTDAKHHCTICKKTTT